VTQELSCEQQIQPNKFEKVILDLFERLSVCIIILGRRGSGKTDMSLLIAEVLNKFGIINVFATNIKIYESPFEIQHITNLQDLELWAKNTQGKKLFILDEAGKSLRRRTPMSGLNIQLIDNLQILRKFKLSLIIIAPHEKYVDSATLGSDILDAIIVKTKFKNPKIALYRDAMEENEIWFNNIPPTQLKFNTWDIAPFKRTSELQIPKFKDSDLTVLWEWSHDKTYKDLGIHPQQLNRILRKFVKEIMERDLHTSQSQAIEDNSKDLNVTNP
jgi:hypothetical protein